MKRLDLKMMCYVMIVLCIADLVINRTFSLSVLGIICGIGILNKRKAFIAITKYALGVWLIFMGLFFVRIIYVGGGIPSPDCDSRIAPIPLETAMQALGYLFVLVYFFIYFINKNLYDEIEKM